VDSVCQAFGLVVVTAAQARGSLLRTFIRLLGLDQGTAFVVVKVDATFHDLANDMCQQARDTHRDPSSAASLGPQHAIGQGRVIDALSRWSCKKGHLHARLRCPSETCRCQRSSESSVSREVFAKAQGGAALPASVRKTMAMVLRSSSAVNGFLRNPAKDPWVSWVSGLCVVPLINTIRSPG